MSQPRPTPPPRPTGPPPSGPWGPRREWIGALVVAGTVLLAFLVALA